MAAHRITTNSKDNNKIDGSWFQSEERSRDGAWPCLVVVGWGEVDFGFEVLGVEGDGDGAVGLGGLGVVEAVGEVVGGDVALAEVGEVEGFFGVAEKSGELVGGVGDVAVAGVGGDDDEGDAEAEAHGVDDGRVDVVVPASPVVPC